MSNESVQFLRQLASGVRPVAPSAAPGQPAAVQAGDFSALLRQAQSGELLSNTPVTVARDAGVSLTEDQLALLSIAADKAEAAGVRTALVILDGQSVTLDVANRVVTGPAAYGEGGVLGGVDGVINLARPAGAAASSAQALPVPPGSLLANPSLLEFFARQQADSEAA